MLSMLLVCNGIRFGSALLPASPMMRPSRIAAVHKSRVFRTFLTSADGTDLQREAASRFFPDTADFKYTPTSGGVSNFMSYLTTPQEDKYLLRVYNNGKNSARVKFEHSVMNQLPMDLSFQLPHALPSLTDGSTHVMLSSGDEACVFRYIPGTLPKVTCVEQIGEACGLLNTLLADVKVDVPCQTPPYYELFKVHHAINRELFFNAIRSTAYDGERASVDRLADYVAEMDPKIQVLLGRNLPQQLIHGDLHYDNVLVADGKVTGLLDFEYCAVDWRAMELAICLSKYAGETNALDLFDTFTRGFAKHGILTEAEIEMVPELIILRVLSNVVFFVGRTLTGEDEANALMTRAAAYNARIEWIRTSREIITNIICKYMRNG